MNLSKQTDLLNLADIYISKWKFIVGSLLVAILFSFIYLRYADYQFETTASIRLKEDKKNNSLDEITALQKYGLFANNSSNINDEITVLKSNTLLESVVKDLKLNIQFFVSGAIKEQETYINPPLELSFIEGDSLIHYLDTTIYVSIIDKNKFKLSNKDSRSFFDFKKEIQSIYNFGDKLDTSFGNLIITPNIGAYGSEVGSQIKINIIPVLEVVESYKEKVKASNMELSKIIQLSLRENISAKAEMILDKLIETYNEQAVNDKEEVLRITSSFINNRLEKVSNELESIDFSAENLKKDNRLSDLSSQSSILLKTEQENEGKINNANTQLQLIEYMSSYINSPNDNSDLLPANIGINDNSVSQLTNSYNSLVMQRNKVLRNSTSKNPIVVNLNSQIAELKQNLTQSLNNVKSSTEITVEALSKEESRIRNQIYATPRKERVFRDITRQQSIKESLFLYLLEKREETAVTLGMSTANAQIVESSFSSTLPVTPKKSIVYFAAFVLGISIPIGLIYIQSLLNTKIFNKAELTKALNIPIIGEIPKSGNKNTMIGKVDYSPIAEAFRLVRTNIYFMLSNINKSKGKVVFVTSTTSKEGKSHTSLNLSRSIAFSNRKTLIIETDIRVPKLNKYMGVKNKTGIGLTNYIIDDKISFADIINNVDENLDMISSGTIPPNPAELLMNNKLEILFNAVKNKYDYVIVDTAAVGLVTDTLLISKFADMVIYVVRANYIDKRQLHVAKSMFEEKRLPNMVTLLNGVVQKKGYGYGYGSNVKSKKWYKFS